MRRIQQLRVILVLMIVLSVPSSLAGIQADLKYKSSYSSDCLSETFTVVCSGRFGTFDVSFLEREDALTPYDAHLLLDWDSKVCVGSLTHSGLIRKLLQPYRTSLSSRSGIGREPYPPSTVRTRAVRLYGVPENLGMYIAIPIPECQTSLFAGLGGSPQDTGDPYLQYGALIQHDAETAGFEIGMVYERASAANRADSVLFDILSPVYRTLYGIRMRSLEPGPIYTDMVYAVSASKYQPAVHLIDIDAVLAIGDLSIMFGQKTAGKNFDTSYTIHRRLHAEQHIRCALRLSPCIFCYYQWQEMLYQPSSILFRDRMERTLESGVTIDRGTVSCSCVCTQHMHSEECNDADDALAYHMSYRYAAGRFVLTGSMEWRLHQAVWEQEQSMTCLYRYGPLAASVRLQQGSPDHWYPELRSTVSYRAGRTTIKTTITREELDLSLSVPLM